MTRLYKGVGVGTFHHGRPDLRTTGVAAAYPGGLCNAAAVMQHIAQGSIASPLISLTRSFGVADDYARNASRAMPTPTNPAYVYTIDIPDPPPAGISVFDPVFFIASHNQNPLISPSYHHDGDTNFLLSIVNPRSVVPVSVRVPPGMTAAVARSPTVTPQLETMVRALRDAEVLVFGNLPAPWFVHRDDIF